jgi:hypothetical protein
MHRSSTPDHAWVGTYALEYRGGAPSFGIAAKFDFCQARAQTIDDRYGLSRAAQPAFPVDIEGESDIETDSALGFAKILRY